jgi:hypothetical protein
MAKSPRSKVRRGNVVANLTAWLEMTAHGVRARVRTGEVAGAESVGEPLPSAKTTAAIADVAAAIAETFRAIP